MSGFCVNGVRRPDVAIDRGSVCVCVVKVGLFVRKGPRRQIKKMGWTDTWEQSCWRENGYLLTTYSSFKKRVMLWNYVILLVLER